ncbi:MAG: hypothetical protein U0519_05055 [Candidatus Gracilibacteria bacterium]
MQDDFVDWGSRIIDFQINVRTNVFNFAQIVEREGHIIPADGEHVGVRWKAFQCQAVEIVGKIVSAFVIREEVFLQRKSGGKKAGNSKQQGGFFVSDSFL